MTLHISLIGRKNLSREICRQVRQAIADGRLRPGEALPPSRVLAQSLSVARATVVSAYETLAGEGLVTSRTGAGMFVSARARAIGSRAASRSGGALRPRSIWESLTVSAAFATPARYDFRTGLPDQSLFPHRNWRRLIARSLRSVDDSARAYHQPAGHALLRSAIARHFGHARGITASADDIVITNGTQQALDLLARVLLEPGDHVAVEDPGYSPPRHLFRALGCQVLGVPVDEEGLIVDALPPRVRLVYVTPSHQYPLGVSMSMARRHALLAWAERHDAAIVEDDYDTEFRFDGRPIDPRQTLDRSGRVIYVGTFSKTLLPTMRLGFVVAPPSLVTAVHKAKYLSDWQTSTLAQAALGHFIESGDYARHIRRINAVYRARHQMIVEIVAREFADHLDLIPSTTGLHVAARASHASTVQITDIVRRASAVDVAIQSLSYFAVSERAEAGIVLGYGAVATKDITAGLRRLKKCVRTALTS